MKTRKVLTVNQVFEILVKWAETKDWETALASVVPKRKMTEAEKARVKAAGEVYDGEGEEVEEVDDDEGKEVEELLAQDEETAGHPITDVSNKEALS